MRSFIARLCRMGTRRGRSPFLPLDPCFRKSDEKVGKVIVKMQSFNKWRDGNTASRVLMRISVLEDPIWSLFQRKRESRVWGYLLAQI